MMTRSQFSILHSQLSWIILNYTNSQYVLYWMSMR